VGGMLQQTGKISTSIRQGATLFDCVVVYNDSK